MRSKSSSRGKTRRGCSASSRSRANSRAGDGHGLPVEPHFVRGQVEPEASEIEHLAVTGAGPESGTGAPQNRLDPGDDLGGRGGLDDVVVAETQTAQLVGIRVTRGQEEDGHLGGLADPAADLESGCPGHHDVQQHAVHRLGGDHGQSPAAVARGEHRAAVGLQVITQDLGDLRGVIDDKDRNRWRHPPILASR
jgi:hypothetical protein